MVLTDTHTDGHSELETDSVHWANAVKVSNGVGAYFIALCFNLFFSDQGRQIK